jgi:hypothetical protein
VSMGKCSCTAITMASATSCTALLQDTQQDMPDNPPITYYELIESKTDTERGAQHKLEYYHTLATWAQQEPHQRA